MTGHARSRFAAVTGAGVFLLALLAALAATAPATALLAALVAGLAAGGAAYAVTSLGAGSGDDRPVTTGRRLDRMAGAPAPGPEAAVASVAVPDPGLAPPPFIPGRGGGDGPAPGDTARLGAAELANVTDLHQTIRLDAEAIQYALPDVSAEDILREREGIDEAFLKAGAGIDEPPIPSENTGGGAPA